MKRRIFILFLCSVMLAGVVSGCGTDTAITDTSPSSSTVEETTEAATAQVTETEYKTMEPPEGGWTIEELMSVTYVCGEQLSYPLTMNSFGNKVEIFEDTLKVHNAKDTPSVMAELCSENEFVGAAFFNRDSVDDVSGDTPINTISFDTHSDFFEKNGSPITLNGVSFGDTKEELIDALGSKAKINEEAYIITYIFDGIQDLKLTVRYDDQGRFCRITFYDLDKGE